MDGQGISSALYSDEDIIVEIDEIAQETGLFLFVGSRGLFSNYSGVMDF
jgi:hypothetical protein